MKKAPREKKIKPTPPPDVGTLPVELQKTLHKKFNNENEIKKAIEHLNKLAKKEIQARLKTETSQLQVSIKKMSHQKELTSKVFQSLKQGIVVLDEDNTIIFINQTAKDIVGKKEEEKFDKQILDTQNNKIKSVIMDKKGTIS